MDFYAESIASISTEIINTNDLIDVYNNRLKYINPNNSEYEELKQKINTLKKDLKELNKIIDML